MYRFVRSSPMTDPSSNQSDSHCSSSSRELMGRSSSCRYSGSIWFQSPMSAVWGTNRRGNGRRGSTCIIFCTGKPPVRLALRVLHSFDGKGISLLHARVRTPALDVYGHAPAASRLGRAAAVFRVVRDPAPAGGVDG